MTNEIEPVAVAPSTIELIAAVENLIATIRRIAAAENKFLLEDDVKPIAAKAINELSASLGAAYAAEKNNLSPEEIEAIGNRLSGLL